MVDVDWMVGCLEPGVLKLSITRACVIRTLHRDYALCAGDVMKLTICEGDRSVMGIVDITELLDVIAPGSLHLHLVRDCTIKYGERIYELRAGDTLEDTRQLDIPEYNIGRKVCL